MRDDVVADRDRFLSPAELAKHIGAIRMGFDKAGVERSGLAIGGECGVEMALVLEGITEIGMGLRKFRREDNRLLCSGNRRLGIAECAMDSAEIGEGFHIIGFDGECLLDPPCRLCVFAALMCDQSQMVEADKVTGLMGEEFGIGRLRSLVTPRAKIFERICE
jgi:hypothetical protein